MQDLICQPCAVDIRLGAPGRMSKSSFLANLLNPASHNMQHFRVGHEMCPGFRGADWCARDLARHGHALMLHVRLESIAGESGQAAIPQQECTSYDADEAAWNGYVEVVRELRAHGVHCTSRGAVGAVINGHAEVIRELLAHDIHCTSRGANGAAKNGHVDVIRELQAHGDLIWRN